MPLVLGVPAATGDVTAAAAGAAVTGVGGGSAGGAADDGVVGDGGVVGAGAGGGAADAEGGAVEAAGGGAADEAGAGAPGGAVVGAAAGGAGAVGADGAGAVPCPSATNAQSEDPTSVPNAIARRTPKLCRGSRLGRNARGSKGLFLCSLTGCPPAYIFRRGEMTEWPKVPDSKSGVSARVPWVRLPLSPPTPRCP